MGPNHILKTFTIQQLKNRLTFLKALLENPLYGLNKIQCTEGFQIFSNVPCFDMFQFYLKIDSVLVICTLLPVFGVYCRFNINKRHTIYICIQTPCHETCALPLIHHTVSCPGDAVEIHKCDLCKMNSSMYDLTVDGVCQSESEAVRLRIVIRPARQECVKTHMWEKI